MKILLVAAAFAASLTLASEDEVAAGARESLHFLPQTLTTLPVADIAASSKWYAQTLGSEIHADLSEIGFMEVTTPTPGFLIGLTQVEEDDAAPQKGNGNSAIVFGTEDIEAASAWLKSHGVKPGEIHDIPGTVRLMEFQDPDGNSLMFYQSLDPE